MQAIFSFGKGRHMPYRNRGLKHAAIVKIMKRIREKKTVVAILGFYLLGDFIQDGMIDGSLLVTIGSYF